MVANRERITTWLKHLLTLVIIVAVAWFVFGQAREMDWPAVGEALRSYGWKSLAVAAMIALPGQVACASFDLVGRYSTGHRLPVSRVMLISITGYYFSLNLGALVGGLAFRYRLYLPYGFRAVRISQIIGLSVLTNWLGYVLIAGFVLTVRPPALPFDSAPSTLVLRSIGIAFLLASAGYLAMCAFQGGRPVRMRGTEIPLPGLRLAGVQYALSVLSWGTIGAVLAWLIPGEVSWFVIMPVLMVSAIAGIWSHVPGGLGVTEAIFLGMLGGQVGKSELLAALVVFRAVYYLLPFLLAVLAYIHLEATAKKIR